MSNSCILACNGQESCGSHGDCWPIPRSFLSAGGFGGKAVARHSCSGGMSFFDWVLCLVRTDACVSLHFCARAFTALGRVPGLTPPTHVELRVNPRQDRCGGREAICYALARLHAAAAEDALVSVTSKDQQGGYTEPGSVWFARRVMFGCRPKPAAPRGARADVGPDRSNLQDETTRVERAISQFARMTSHIGSVVPDSTISRFGHAV